MNNILYKAEGGEQFWCSKDQANVLDVLKQLNKGGIGTVHGYIPESGWEISPKLDLQIITRISVSALYKRKIAALDGVSFADVKPFLANEPKLAALDEPMQRSIFNDRKQKLIDSMTKTLSGDRSDALREGHDRNYITVCQGVKVNLEGDKVDAIKVPKLFNGYPIANTIMLMYLEISRKEISPGQRKKAPNSGAEVLMGNLIENQLNAKSVGIKTLSLDPAKFDSISVSKQQILKEDLAHAFKELTMVEMILELIEAYNA